MFGFWLVLSHLAQSPLVGFFLMIGFAVLAAMTVHHINARRSK
jgi:predicted outer membrane lipoprotein